MLLSHPVYDVNILEATEQPDAPLSPSAACTVTTIPYKLNAL